MNRFFRHIKNHFVPHKGNEYKPHLLRHESMLVFFLIIIIVELAFLAQVFIVFDKTKFLASVLPGVLTSLTNNQRENNSLPDLKENNLLTQAAQLKANDMAARGYFSHNTPDGKTPWYWLEQVGYKYSYAGENLAVNFFESDEVAQAWMNSPSHRANIVKKDYTEIGIAVASGIYEGRNTVFVVQFFGTPRPAPAIVTKKTEEPKSTPVVNTPTVVKQTSPTGVTPSENKVLGEEAPVLKNTKKVTKTEVIPVTPTKKIEVQKTSDTKLFFQDAATTPRKSVAYVYGFIALILTLVLLITFFIRSEIQHPIIMVRGLALMGAIVILLFFNIQVFDSKIELPLDNSNSTFIAN